MPETLEPWLPVLGCSLLAATAGAIAGFRKGGMVGALLGAVAAAIAGFGFAAFVFAVADPLLHLNQRRVRQLLLAGAAIVVLSAIYAVWDLRRYLFVPVPTTARPPPVYPRQRALLWLAGVLIGALALVAAWWTIG